MVCVRVLCNGLMPHPWLLHAHFLISLNPEQDKQLQKIEGVVKSSNPVKERKILLMKEPVN